MVVVDLIREFAVTAGGGIGVLLCWWLLLMVTVASNFLKAHLLKIDQALP